MASCAKYTLVMLAVLAAGIATARAQTSEFDALPKPAVVAKPPAAESTQHPTVNDKSVTAEPKQKTAGEKAQVRENAKENTKEKENAKEKAAVLPSNQEPAGQKKAAALKQEKDEGDVQLGRKMAPSASIPPWPGDEKGPKTIEFLGACPGNFDRCMDQVREIGEKMSAAELCIPTDLYFATVTDRVRKWATLRPDIHGQPAGRVIAAALRSIYPCKHGAPARTAAEKDAKGAKAAQ